MIGLSTASSSAAAWEPDSEEVAEADGCEGESGYAEYGTGPEAVAAGGEGDSVYDMYGNDLAHVIADDAGEDDGGEDDAGAGHAEVPGPSGPVERPAAEQPQVPRRALPAPPPPPPPAPWTGTVELHTCGLWSEWILEDNLVAGLSKLIGHDVHYMIDCRPITDPNHDKRLRGHIGLHPDILMAIGAHELFGQILVGVHDMLQALTPADVVLRIVCYCRSGRHRSVAVATLLAHVLPHALPTTANVVVQHASKWAWAGGARQQPTCQGACLECQDREAQAHGFDLALTQWHNKTRPVEEEEFAS